jgi:hypothetical protein
MRDDMKISELIQNLTNVQIQRGDIKVLIADSAHSRRAYDINRGDIMLTDMKQVLVLVPNAQEVANNNAIIGGLNGIGN